MKIEQLKESDKGREIETASDESAADTTMICDCCGRRVMRITEFSDKQNKVRVCSDCIDYALPKLGMHETTKKPATD